MGHTICFYLERMRTAQIIFAAYNLLFVTTQESNPSIWPRFVSELSLSGKFTLDGHVFMCKPNVHVFGETPQEINFQDKTREEIFCEENIYQVDPGTQNDIWSSAEIFTTQSNCLWFGDMVSLSTPFQHVQHVLTSVTNRGFKAEVEVNGTAKNSTSTHSIYCGTDPLTGVYLYNVAEKSFILNISKGVDYASCDSTSSSDKNLQEASKEQGKPSIMMRLVERLSQTADITSNSPSPSPEWSIVSCLIFVAFSFVLPHLTQKANKKNNNNPEETELEEVKKVSFPEEEIFLESKLYQDELKK